MKLTRNDPAATYRYGRTLPDGIHDAVVLGATENISRNDNEMIVLTLGAQGPEGGVRVDHHVVAHLSDLVEELLGALAPEHLDDWREHGACDLDPETLVDRSCKIRVSNEPWNGSLRPRIRALIRARS